MRENVKEIEREQEFMDRLRLAHAIKMNGHIIHKQEYLNAITGKSWNTEEWEA